MANDASPEPDNWPRAERGRFHPVEWRNFELGSPSSPALPDSPLSARYSPSALDSASMAVVDGGFGRLAEGIKGIGGSSSAVTTTFSTTAQILALFQQVLTDQFTPLRLAGHLAVLAIAAAVLVLSQITIPEWELSLEPTPAPLAGMPGEVGTSATARTIPADGSADALALRRNIVFNLVDQKVQPAVVRQDIAYYMVKPGDTVLAIAQKHGLQPETLMWSNSAIEQNPDWLSVGDELRILPIDGVLHVVKPDETLSDLADEYEVDMQAIVGYSGNGLASLNDPLPIGKEIVVPGGTKPFVGPVAGPDYSGAYSVQRPANAPAGSGNFSWPSAGYVSQGYWGGHPAIDIVGWSGSPVAAADGGYVVLAGGGWNGGYGNNVIVDHGNGFTTLYAHLTSVFVNPGETVSKGQQIGTMGNTGNSTGPHLHFEVRYNGVPYDPAGYLR